MTQETVTDIIQMALFTVVKVSMPPLLVGLSIGILVSVFQAVTSIQEATLAFVPKILGVLFAILFFGSYMQENIAQLFISLYSNLPYYITPR